MQQQKNRRNGTKKAAIIFSLGFIAFYLHERTSLPPTLAGLNTGDRRFRDSVFYRAFVSAKAGVVVAALK